MIAKGDVTYCTNDECKNKCDLHYSYYEFETDRFYIGTSECAKNIKGSVKKVKEV